RRVVAEGQGRLTHGRHTADTQPTHSRPAATRGRPPADPWRSAADLRPTRSRPAATVGLAAGSMRPAALHPVEVEVAGEIAAGALPSVRAPISASAAAAALRAPNPHARNAGPANRAALYGFHSATCT